MKFTLQLKEAVQQRQSLQVRFNPLACKPGRNCFRITLMVLAMAVPSMALGQESARYFRANCMTCHTIGGGRLTGPDLKDVTKRKDREWLIKFIQNPTAVIDSGDPYAAKLLESARGVKMPLAAGMNAARAEDMLKLIEAESKLPESQFQGAKFSTKPFTDKDRAAGRAIFVGTQKLLKGGSACNSCHSMYDLPAFGGGHLGPDLTRVYERLKGRKALSAWLIAPATETMQPIFKDHPLEVEEINSLVAYFEEAAGHDEANASVSRIAFLLTGLVFATAIIFLFDVLWKGRFHAVRRPLVEGIRRAIHRGVGKEDKPASVAASVAAESDG